jgi:hypothetical protein
MANLKYKFAYVAIEEQGRMSDGGVPEWISLQDQLK